MSSIASGTTTTTGLVYTSDTTGNLVLQTNGTTTAVTIDTNQNMGLGVTPSAWYSGSSWHVIQQAGGGAWSSYLTGGTTPITYFSTNLYWNTSAQNIYITSNAATNYTQAGGAHNWQISSGTPTAGSVATMIQAMTLGNNGVFSVGGTSDLGAGLSQFFDASGRWCVTMCANNPSSGTYYLSIFKAGASNVGSITSNGTTTTYGTASDRRLKTNIVDLTNSGTVIDSLKPRAFTWISDNSADAGFIADEFQQVLPKAVVGQPNAVDAEGKPVYQMIDASQPELIAYLVAEVQSLRARLKAANIA